MVGWKIDSGVYLISNGNGYKVSINGKFLSDVWKSLDAIATGAFAKALSKVVLTKPVAVLA